MGISMGMGMGMGVGMGMNTWRRRNGELPFDAASLVNSTAPCLLTSRPDALFHNDEFPWDGGFLLAGRVAVV